MPGGQILIDCPIRRKTRLFVQVLCLMFGCMGWPQNGWLCAAEPAAEPVILRVSSGRQDRVDAIARIAVPAALREAKRLRLMEVNSQKRVPVQIDTTADRPQLVWIVGGRLKSGQSRDYSIEAAPADAPTATPPRVTVEDDGQRLTMKVAGKPVLVYHQAVVPSPDPAHPYYARSGHIHPLYNPAGQVVSDDFNPDHAHQHGVMFAWRQTTFEGRSTNGWDQRALTGRIEHVRTESIGSGQVFAHFRTRLHHVDLTAPKGEKVALREHWLVKLYAVDDAFVFDLQSTQRCASESPVTVDEYHYGGLMLRGHADWHRDRSYDFLTSQGKSKRDGNHTRPQWVDLFGPLEGQTTGVTIFDHPQNFRFPQPVRLHPTMPYFCFTPALMGDFTLQPQEPFVLRYRFRIHNGPADPDTTDRIWADYAQPVQVKVVPEEG